MKSLIFILLLAFGFNSNHKCYDVKTGSFKVVTEEFGTTFITRTARKQIEVNEDMGVKVKYKVKWLNECTYQLYDSKVYRGNDLFKEIKTDTLTVIILDVTDNYYLAKVSSNLTDFTTEFKIEIVE